MVPFLIAGHVLLLGLAFWGEEGEGERGSINSRPHNIQLMVERYIHEDSGVSTEGEVGRKERGRGRRREGGSEGRREGRV